MGDSNTRGHNDEGRQYAGRAGMEALMSAIEYQRMGTTHAPQVVENASGNTQNTSGVYGGSGYSMMANLQDHKSGNTMQLDDRDKASLHAAQLSSQAAALYSSQFQTNALNQGVANSFWGLNSMLMPMVLPGLRPALAGQSPANLLPQAAVAAAHWAAKASENTRADAEQAVKCTLCGAVCSDAREFHSHFIQKHPNVSPYLQSEMPSVVNSEHSTREGRYQDTLQTSKSVELPSLPAGYPNLPYSHFSVDKLSSAHQAAIKAMRYPTPNAISPYLGMTGIPGLLAANSGLLPQMAPSNWNAALGALHPYYQNSIMSRLPNFQSQFAQNSLLRMPTDINALRLQGQNPESKGPKLDTASLLDQTRPQSGGYSPMKESLQRRVSAPLMSSSGQRIPGSGETLRGAGGAYPGFPHRSHLPAQLIAPTVETNKSAGAGKGRIDHKSIEQHISKLISHNEKVLHSPTLDKVKPRRVFRRSSLDPASLNTSANLHNPLTATHSAPRSLDPKYSQPLLEDKTSERHNFLTVPSRRVGETSTSQNAETSQHMQKAFRTYIPDPRRDPNGQHYIPAVTDEHKFMTDTRNRPTFYDKHMQQYHQSLQRREQRPKETSHYQCAQCGAQFTKQETYDVHKNLYCPNKKSPKTSSSVRQSVIQHTGIQSEDDDPKPSLPEVKVSPPDPQDEVPFVSKSEALKTSLENSELNTIVHSQLLENPMRYVRKEIHRSHSADTAFQMSRNMKLVQGNVGDDFGVTDPPAASKNILSPPKSDQSDPITPVDTSINKSSIPTNKLPPKKKQLQLMRSNSSNKSHLDVTKSPQNNPSPLTLSSDTSPSSQRSKTPEESPERHPPLGKLKPPLSLSLDTSLGRKALPPWIPLDVDDKLSPNTESCGSLGPAPTIYLPENPDSSTKDSVTSTSSALLHSPTGGKSPTSPRSPSRRLSPGRGSRSPSRSPTSSLESTIPRSNYKLLLHQLSLRNMQDMDYLSEAYHNSKDKTLKRNIASLLWSSDGSKSSDGGASPKRTRPLPYETPKMDELYPGKAMLARRLSPNADSRLLKTNDQLPSPKLPLSQSRSRPYEGRHEFRPSVTRSHSTGNGSDVNNNIKQFLQNKSRNQQQQSSSSSGNPLPTKTHKPLTRTNANARFLLKSRDSASQDEPRRNTLETRKSLSKLGQSSLDGHLRLKESLALKRASSYNPESAVDYQSKRQRLIPIPRQSTATTHTTLPTSLVTSRLTEHNPIPSTEKDASNTKLANTPHAVPSQFLLHPHLTPSLGFDPHPTFCSLVSPQPMYVELDAKSTLSMYSQWAVSKPLMLPEGLNVMDMFKNTRVLKGLSPYISYNSLFMSAQEKDQLLKLTDTKEYESNSKGETSKEDKSSENQSDPVETEDKTDKKIQNEEDGDKLDSLKEWIYSQVNLSKMFQSKSCYTSCHNKVTNKKNAKTTTTSSNENSKITKPELPRRLSELPPPEVIIHPPSPPMQENSERRHSSNSSQKNDIAALEFSDQDSDDDDALKIDQSEHFLRLKKGASLAQNEVPSSSFLSGSDKVNIPMETEINHKSSGNCQTNSHDGYENSQVECNNRNISPDVKCRHSASSQGQSSGEDNDDAMKIKNKKVRRSRKERNASSPRLQKSSNDFPDSPSAFEDPSLAVHPTGACKGASDDPSKICALCSMKAGGSKCPGAAHSTEIEETEKSEDGIVNQKKDDSASKPYSPTACSEERPQTPSRPKTPRTPNSNRPKTPIPLTVSVPKHTRDRSFSKTSKKSLAPGILDKARGNGTTQHWVTTSDLQQSPTRNSKQPEEETKVESSQKELKNDKTVSQNIGFSMSEYYSSMPPNKNPVSDLNLQKTNDPGSPATTTANGGLQALAAVVSGVMRSAAIQSKKKMKNSKHGMTEMLSHSRPLIPTSELNGSATKNHERLSEKLAKSEKNNKLTNDQVLGPSTTPPLPTGHGLLGKQGKPSMRHLSLSTRESELFLNKANETKTTSLLTGQTDSECDTGVNWSEDHEEGEHFDSAKEDIAEGDGESSNPRPHKCSECKIAFRIAGHLAKHLRSKGHIIAMQKKTLNRLKQQKFSGGTGISTTGHGVTVSTSSITTSGSPEQLYQQQANQEELLTQLGEGAETLARAQVRALLEGNEEYAEINTGSYPLPEPSADVAASDDEGEYSSLGIEGQGNSSDPRPFKCIACKIAFRFQGHLDRHFRSNMHLLAVGHFESDKNITCENNSDPDLEISEEDPYSFTEFHPATLENGHHNDKIVHNDEQSENQNDGTPFVKTGESDLNVFGKNGLKCHENTMHLHNTFKDQNFKQDCNNNSTIENNLAHLKNGEFQLDEISVNQPTEVCDSLKNSSIKINCVSNFSKEPVNGLRATSPHDSLNSISIKRQSPVIQSNTKTLLEAPPTLPEMPLPSTSPVQNRQQLTC